MHEHQSKRQPTKTFVEALAQDAGVESSAELAKCMEKKLENMLAISSEEDLMNE